VEATERPLTSAFLRGTIFAQCISCQKRMPRQLTVSRLRSTRTALHYTSIYPEITSNAQSWVDPRIRSAPPWRSDRSGPYEPRNVCAHIPEIEAATERMGWQLIEPDRAHLRHRANIGRFLPLLQTRRCVMRISGISAHGENGRNL
jgi:hypothetical protein